jgi:beta-lactamase regulating signal transducer with metallopeptidase domain
MKITILVLVGLLATRLLRTRSAALRHWILASAVLCAGALPLFAWMAPSWPLSLRHASFSQLVAESPLASPPPRPASAAAERRTRQPVGSVEGVAPNRRRDWSVASAVQPIRIGGIVTSLLALVAALTRLVRIRSRAHPFTSGNWSRLLDEISGDYGLRRRVTLLQSDRDSLLATWGVASPCIIVPAAAERWPDALIRSVLCHELAHVSRGDWVIQMTAEIVRSFYWFNPLVWFACARLRLESEQACDESVLRSGIAGPVYASHLLGLARTLNQRPTLWPAPAMARSSSLHKRVTAMLNDCQDARPISRSGRIATAIVFVIVASAIAAAQVFATFSGSLTDPQGAVMPGVHVTLSNPDRQTKYDAQSNRRGEFEFVGLPPGDYVFDVQVPGFKAYRAALTMAGADVRRPITLQIGTLREEINVADGATSSIPPVETASARTNPPCPASASTGEPPIGGNIRPPHKIRDVKPLYPASLRGTGAEGTVVLDARIGVDGFIKDPRVREPANREFANALVAAVSQWQFDSTLLNCQPVEPEITVTGHFLQGR